MRTLLILLVVVLAGANIAYFLLARDPAMPLFDRTPIPASPAGRAIEPSSDVLDVPAAPSVMPAPARRADDVAAAGASRVASPPGEDAGVAPASESSPRIAPEAATGLIVPVQGMSANQLSDTFDDARGNNRVHEALDIMAARGTPVLAVADGRIEKLFDSDRGGLTIYQFEPSGRYAYYYAHLDRYAAGVVEGEAVRQGEVIGYVGSTGNAAEDAPHLHFAIFALGPEKHWWEGTAINPYPLLTVKRPL